MDVLQSMLVTVLTHFQSPVIVILHSQRSMLAHSGRLGAPRLLFLVFVQSTMILVSSASVEPADVTVTQSSSLKHPVLLTNRHWNGVRSAEATREKDTASALPPRLNLSQEQKHSHSLQQEMTNIAKKLASRDPAGVDDSLQHHEQSVVLEKRRHLQIGSTVETACAWLNGSLDDSGRCIVCLGENCLELADDLTASSEAFCTTTAYPASAKQTFCGPVSCHLASIFAISCRASIPVLDDHVLKGKATCDLGLKCDCNFMTWDGQACSSCTGAAEGYDCRNVGGPVVFAPVKEKAADVPRKYRTSWFFQKAVAARSMADASQAAGVPIGGAAGMSLWDDGTVGKFVPDDYTRITPTNEMKWPTMLRDKATLGDYDFTKIDRFADYAVAAGIKVRGHVLIWGVEPGRTYPASIVDHVEASDDPKTTLIEIMREHIRTVALHFGDRVDVWDVVNEHFLSRYDDNVFYKVLGDDYVRTAFELAREVLPSSPLVWTEIVPDYSLDSEQIIGWLDMLQRYKDEGVPIDRIGVQAHEYALQDSRLDDLRLFFRKVADMGYGVEVTEYDAPLTIFLQRKNMFDIFHDPYQAQADYAAGYLRACLDSGRCEGFTTWGISDAVTWLDSELLKNGAPNLPLLIDQEGYRKPVWLSIRRELEAFAAPPTVLNWFFVDSTVSFLFVVPIFLLIYSRFRWKVVGISKRLYAKLKASE